MSMDRDDRNARESAYTRTSDQGLPWKLIALLVLMILLAFFFFQNGEEVHVDFLWFDGEWPLWLVIGLSVAVGVVLDRLITWQWRRARLRRANAG
jgi:uncharacterized integral membrane protein